MPCAIGAFLRKSSEFSQHPRQTSHDVCDKDVIEQLHLKNESYRGRLSSFELKLIASS